MRSPNLDDIVESSLTRKEAPNHAKNKLATGTWDDVCFSGDDSPVVNKTKRCLSWRVSFLGYM
ncbi:uncharacterized protein LOC117159383 isoform X2 [Bombus vancouverensis nearcticus]|uniref:uncharacterized protein LOC117159383 isoform X2 n=1 Tax=Bombus vancouverensis nearcticus TaxID=2705178 RepID=UPI00402B2EFB